MATEERKVDIWSKPFQAEAIYLARIAVMAETWMDDLDMAHAADQTISEWCENNGHRFQDISWAWA